MKQPLRRLPTTAPKPNTMIDTNEIRGRLEQDLTRITAELSTIATHNEETDDWVAVPDREDAPDADDNTEADLVEDWNERRATLAALETEYQDIKRALRKIADGTYGICEVSGEPIEEDRLEAYPTARTCKAHLEDASELPL